MRFLEMNMMSWIDVSIWIQCLEINTCKGRKYVIKNILKIRFISFIFEIFAISFICSFDIPISIQVLFHWLLRRYVCFHVSHYDAFLFLCRIPWSGVSLFTINQYLWSIAACVNGTSLSLLSTQYTLGPYSPEAPTSSSSNWKDW